MCGIQPKQTDSIAWNSLSRALFQQLFRQDLLVASLFRNFLMADRVLRSLGCTPQSLPRLPSGTSQHQLWQSWDLAAECSLSAFLGLKIPPTINTPLQPYAAIPGMHHQGMPNATTLASRSPSHAGIMLRVHGAGAISRSGVSKRGDNPSHGYLPPRPGGYAAPGLTFC